MIINDKPRVIKSDISIKEINESSQKNLHKRQNSDSRKKVAFDKWLFGAEKVRKNLYGPVVMAKKFSSIPFSK